MLQVQAGGELIAADDCCAADDHTDHSAAAVVARLRIGVRAGAGARVGFWFVHRLPQRGQRCVGGQGQLHADGVTVVGFILPGYEPVAVQRRGCCHGGLFAFRVDLAFVIYACCAGAVVQVITELIALFCYVGELAFAVIAGLGHFALEVVALVLPLRNRIDRICIVFFAIGIVMGQHFALAPHEFPINTYIRKVTGMRIGSSKTKQL